jgi:hypothetical protein
MWSRFTCSTLSFWISLFIVQGPKENSPLSPVGLEIRTSQGFKGVGFSREGQRLLLLNALESRLTNLSCLTQDSGGNLRSAGNANKHPGSLREVFRFDRSQLRALPELPKSTNRPH